MSIVAHVYRYITMVACVLSCMAIAVGGNAGSKNRGDVPETTMLASGQAANVSGAPEESVTVVTSDHRARLFSKPNGSDGDVITRIKTGSKLKVLSSSTVKMPMWSVIWYKVNYKGKTGWVSEFDTDRAPSKPHGIR